MAVRWFAILATAFFVAVRPGLAAGSDGWQELASRHAIVAYQRPADLVLFNRQIRFGPEPAMVDGNAEAVAAGVAEKMDALFQRAQQILDMRGKIDKVIIRLYPDRQALNQAYYSLFRAQCTFRAWYLYEKKTVYLNVTDVHAGMVAHEMGHHIIDHYFKIRPPAATAEILARYIDAHLFEKGR